MRGLHTLRVRVISSIMAVLVVLSVPFTVASASTADQTRNGRLITFHDRGDTKVILTHTQTVRDAVHEAEIHLADEDIVEPGLDEQLVAADYTINIYRARPVIVDDGLLRTKIMTAGQTAQAIAKDADMNLRLEDKASLKVNPDFITDGAGEILSIKRAIEFTLNLYGTKTTAYTNEATVGDMLAAKDIQLGDKDELSPGYEAPMEAGMNVAIWREGVQTQTLTEDVPFTTRYIHDVDQPLGYSKVKTPGVKGSQKVTYEITIRNGKEVSRKALKKVVLEQPIEQVEVIGAKGGFAAALAKLRQCEAGGNYANKNNSLYRGAYQFSYETWANNGGYRDPADAPPSLQDAAAAGLYQRRGWQPWPACSASLGLQDIYR